MVFLTATLLCWFLGTTGRKFMNTFTIKPVSLNCLIWYRISNGVTTDEFVLDYDKRFRYIKNQCFNLTIAEKDLVDLVLFWSF